MTTIQYFFDFLSPFSYFSWINSKVLREDDQNLFEYYPVLMSKLFAHHEQKGPGEIPPKRDFLFKKCLYYAEKMGIPFEVPHHLPFIPLLPLRLATKGCSGEKQEEVIDALWSAAWQDSINMESPEELSSYLTKKNLNGEELVERSFQGEIKRELKKNIQLATQKNLYGVPSFWTEKEQFWGNDSLPELEQYLENNQQYYSEQKFDKFLQEIHKNL